ncbi:MAG TPA: hypothetical protein VH744_09080, partial [Terriglobales bacterium]
ARLRLITRAPAWIQSMIAAASSPGVAVGICSLPVTFSGKMGRTRSVQPGHIAGAAEFRVADKIPATNVPWRHAALLARVHVAP